MQNIKLILKKRMAIPIIIGILVVSAIIGGFFVYKKPSTEVQWKSSGPFAIDKSNYKLGENIFISVHGLKPKEIGNIVFILPGGKTWTTIPFNGTSKSDFNFYLKPDTSAVHKIFNPADLVGQWSVEFEGVKYDPLHFEILNEFIPGGEQDIIPINPNATKTNSTG